MAMMSPNNSNFELPQHLDDISDANVDDSISFFSSISNFLSSLESSFWNYISTPQNEVSEDSLVNESERYKRELSSKASELKKSLGLRKDIDLLNDHSLELFKRLSENVSWGRFGLQWTVGLVSSSYTKTQFQELVDSIENLNKEFDNFSNEIQNVENSLKSNSISTINKTLASSKKNIKRIQDSISLKYEELKENIKKWRTQKKVETDVDKLKIIALTNFLESVNLTNLNRKLQFSQVRMDAFMGILRIQRETKHK